MKTEYFTIKEWSYYLLRQLCLVVVYIPSMVGNWATDKLNESYYQAELDQDKV